jgi:DNA-binding MarR family transcriptional regulator
MHQTIARTADPRAVGHQPPEVNALELQVLRAIERLDGAPMDAIPTRWPLIRMHVPAAVDRLVNAGLVTVGPTIETGGAVTLTDRGRRLLRASAL